MAVDLSSFAVSFGFSGAKVDVLQGYKDLVYYLNAHGGLAGRKIAPDFYTVSGSSPDAGAAFQTACTHFVADAKVRVVISDDVFDRDFDTCLAHAGIVHIDAAKYGIDATAQKQSPNYLAPTTFGIDRLTAALIESSLTTGFIKPKDKIGVLIEGCPINIRTYNDVWVQRAKQSGFSTTLLQTDCNAGASSLGPVVSQVESAVLRFKAAGAKSVTFISQGEGFFAVLFAIAAQQQGWHPQYLVTSISTPERGVESQGSALSMPREQLAQMKGVGWLPMTDVGARAPAPSALQRQALKLCNTISPSAGGAKSSSDPGVRLDNTSHYLMECDTMLTFRSLLAATSGDTSLRALQGVYARVLATVPFSSNLSGAIRPVGGRTDGQTSVAPFSYFADCGCMKYVGPARSVS